MSARVFILIMNLVSLAYHIAKMRLADIQRKRPLPAEVADVFEPERYRTYLNYTADNRKFFLVKSILSLIIMPIVDPALGHALPTFGAITDSWFTILYAGIMSCGVAYTLQVVGQKYTDPAIASMILCLESVFALIAGMIILGEMMSIREILGCAIMFAAIVIANLPVSTRQRN